MSNEQTLFERFVSETWPNEEWDNFAPEDQWRVVWDGARTSPLLALRNCHMLAKKMLQRNPEDENWAHIKRLCEDAGVRSSILRVERAKTRSIPVYNRHPYGEEETVKGTGEDEGRG